MTYGEHFVLLAESVAPYLGWAWVAKYPHVKVCGWVPTIYLECTNQTVFLEGAKIAEDMSPTTYLPPFLFASSILDVYVPMAQI